MEADVSLLPLFPLPNVVLFPGVSLPLHVFEPRYRALVADALASDRRIGMVLLRPGWEGDYDGRPPVYGIGCSGVIVHDTRLGDGRYHIILRGLDRFRIVDEDRARAYRRATIEPLPEPPAGARDGDVLRALRPDLESRVGPLTEAPGGLERTHLASMPDADFVHTLAQYLDLDPIEKQALLEQPTLRLRAEALVELLDIKKLEGMLPGVPSALQ